MNRRTISWVLTGLLIGCALSSAHARGRRPDDDEEHDSFPDYNRIDIHSKTKAAPAPPPAGSDNVPPGTPAKSPSLNTPLNFSSDDDLTPKPPPPAVPVSDNASEPPLPDEIKNNLIQGTTDQK